MIPVELPSFEATWWPLQMEPIPGSGEALTVAVLARAASGQSQVRQVIAPALLASLFGTAGKGVQALVGSTVVDLQAQLDAGAPATELALPYGGFAFGPARDGVARDLNEVFDVAVRLSAAFGVSAFGRRDEAADSSKEAFDDWADRVRTELLLHEGRLALEDEIFRVPVKLARKQVRFGLLHGSYVANFGVLRPGHLAGDTRSLKVKLFDLEALRRDQLHPIEHADALVGCPAREAMASYSRRELDSYFNSLEFLESEARARRVEFVRCTSPQEAAQRVRLRLAA